MMRLIDFANSLSKLVAEGHGNKQVFYRHGSSGDCGELSTPDVTDVVDECGPFDMNGAEYISIYAGN